MKPALFTYLRPNTVDEALGMLAEYGERAKLIAGGQSLVPMMNLRIARPEAIIDINGLKDLAYHRIDGNELRIGAMARHSDLAESALVAKQLPLITAAYKHVAHGTIRNRGTLCGNLSHADPASEMPAVMLVLDAQMVLRSKRGERVVPASNFFEGMYTTALRADEMLTEVRVPVGQSKSGFGFEEISVRQGDYAIALVASAVAVANGKISAASLAFAGVSDKALRFPALEKKLIGQVPTETLFSEVSEEAIKMIFTDTDNSDDRVYRQDLIRSLTPRALKQAVAAAAN